MRVLEDYINLIVYRSTQQNLCKLEVSIKKTI